eukprot:403334744
MDSKILPFVHLEIGSSIHLPKLDYPRITKLTSIQPYTLNISLDEEFDFQEEYSKIKESRKEKEREGSQRRERLDGVLDNIRIKQEQFKKQEEERINLQFVMRLQDEERKAVERERQQRQQAEQQESSILQIINRFSQIDYDGAKLMLQQHKWNLEQVLNILTQRYQEQEQQEMTHHSNAVTLISEFSHIEYDQARQVLKKHNGNLESARNEIRLQNQFSLSFSMRDLNNKELEVLRTNFNQNDDGMSIIIWLQGIRPIGNMYYRIYKDPSCQVEISYINLSQSFVQLGIKSNDTFFVKKDNNYPY